MYSLDNEVKKQHEPDCEFREKALHEAVLAAEQAASMKGEFLFDMSQAIRTSLGGIIGFTDLAREEPNISGKVVDYLSKVKNSATELLDVIDAVLDILALEAGDVGLETVPFNLHDLIRECKALNSEKAQKKGVSLYAYAERQIGKTLLGDAAKLRRVLLNLLSNAVKYTNTGIIQLMASATGFEEKNVTILFEVKDSGIGMAPEQMEKVFTPFSRADGSTPRKQGGMGLPIAKALVGLMGGELMVESVPGQGCSFSFSLRFVTVEEFSPTEKTSHPLPVMNTPFFKGDVLVCEDNEVNRQIIREHLERMGLRPVIVSNGQDGLEEVERRMRAGTAFDLILMDIHMPVMDGLAATRALVKMGVRTPVVALTANVLELDRQVYMANGMADYLAKPFTEQALRVTLLKYLMPVRHIAFPAAKAVDSGLSSFLSGKSIHTEPVTAAPGTLDREKALLLVEDLLPLVKAGDAQCLHHTDAILEALAPVGSKCSALVAQISDCEFTEAFETLMEIRQILEG